MGRLLEQRPEVVADHVGGNLPTAYRATDEGAHEVLGVIQHELVARHCRDRFEGFERVGPVARAVAWQRGGMPVAGVEQLLDPLELLRPHRIGDVRLVHDHALHRDQPVVEVGARRVVGAARGDQVDRLTARCTRTHPLEEVALLATNEIDVRQEQVLVQPAADQRLGGTRAVEQLFPVGNLLGFGRAWLDRLVLDGCTGGQPVAHGVVFLVGQAGHRQWHAFLGVSAGIGIELMRQRAHVVAVQAQDDFLGQLGIGRERGLVPQLEHARHQRGLAALVVEHRVEALLAPLALAMGVVEQPRGGHCLAALALVHGNLGGAAHGAFGAFQLQLAGGVVAGVAGHAFLGEDRLNVPGVGNGRARLGGLPERHTADEQGENAGKNTMHHVRKVLGIESHHDLLPGRPWVPCFADARPT